MQLGSVADWVNVLIGIFVGSGVLVWWNARNANKAKLEAKCELSTFGLSFCIKNTGAKAMIIQHIEMCVGEQHERRMAVESSKKSEIPPNAFSLYDPAVLSDESDVIEVGQNRTRLVSMNFNEDSVFQFKDFARSKKEAKTMQFVVCATRPPAHHSDLPVDITDCETFQVKTGKSVVAEILKAVASEW